MSYKKKIYSLSMHPVIILNSSCYRDETEQVRRALQNLKGINQRNIEFSISVVLIWAVREGGPLADEDDGDDKDDGIDISLGCVEILILRTHKKRNPAIEDHGVFSSPITGLNWLCQ